MEFETWWKEQGQFHRAGGGDYEKTFAWGAWNAAIDAAAKVAMKGPLIESCGEYPYMTETCKAMAVSVFSRTVDLKAPA